ncbi:MAG TPA: protein kinase [Pyrinomonadaceae bacterium]|nr:protein kinase [Pyrinomonadaceae bacterium]
MITHDRWPRIKEIFHSALDHAPAERSVFLNQVCGNDAALREEVETLLIADAETENFLTQPAYEFAAGMLADGPSEFSAGQGVGQYEIECFLSSGGMGQIYEAHDTKLGRKIALKFISPEYAKDPHRVQRFEQEARAASALNHPNVCVIHDIGVTDSGRHFIAMEFILGSTLRDKLARQGPLQPLEALQIIIQVGDALASAHAKGIVHRDIKPENIMLRPDGFVKVVDFGLAKLTEILPDQRYTDKAKTKLHTEPHSLMGTVKYMSPEQLQEVPVDERTDIWSLGIVLYEMLTGETPFEARSPNESIARILTSQPQFNEIPFPLREIIKKALEKDCTQRYETITKFTADLRRLKRELEMNPEADFLPFGEFQFSPDLDHRKEELPKTGSEIFTRFKSQAILTADTLFTEIRTPRGAAIFLSLTALLFLVPLAISWINETNKKALFQGPVEKLTQDGKAICAAISPDDKWVAYVEDHNGKQRLVVINMTNSGTSFPLPPENVQYLGLAFSHDSNFLYFTRIEKGLGILYQLAWPGNNPVKLKEGVDSPISLSPQGDRFAFVRYDAAKTEFFLVLSNIDGTNEQVVANRKDGRTLSLNGVAWSPDGNFIVCPVGDWTQGWRMNLIAFNLENGGEQQIGNQSWYAIQQVDWQQELNGPVISAKAGLLSPHQLFQIPFPDGDAHRITNDPSEYTTSVSLSDKKLVTISTERHWRIGVVTLDNHEEMTEITRGSSLNYGLSWSSNGYIVFSSMTQNDLNIYRINPDGSNKVQLTVAAGNDYMPASSPDGRFIVFVSERSGTTSIWRMNADDGSEQTRLTHGDSDYYPSCSPDNQWVAYDNLSEWKASVWKVPIDGGEAVKVGENYRMPVFSPDGQLIACRYDLVSGSRDIAIFPAQGGEPLEHFEVPHQDWQSVQFFQNTSELSYVKNEHGYSNIWIYDRKTGTSKPITNFKSDQIYAYAWSPNYKRLALLRGTKTNNVVIISNSER